MWGILVRHWYCVGGDDDDDDDDETLVSTSLGTFLLYHVMLP